MASDVSEFSHLFSFTPSVDCISGLKYAIVNERIGSDFGYLLSLVLFFVCVVGFVHLEFCLSGFVHI